MQNEALSPKLLAGFLLLPSWGGEPGVLYWHYRDCLELCTWQGQCHLWAAFCRGRVSKAVLLVEFYFTTSSGLDTRAVLKTW